MKSTIFSLLPFAGLAVAESVCSIRQTVTQTKHEKVYETVKAADVGVKAADVKSAACSSRSTVTKTVSEKVYVTVTPDAIKDTTITNTVDIYTTITVRPSGYFGNSSTSVVRQPSGESADAPSYPTLSVLPTSQFESAAAAQPQSATSASASAKSTYTPSASPAPILATTAETAAAGSKRGDATFYGGNVSGGMCSFSTYTIPSSLTGTALSDSNWASASACGTCVLVTGPSGATVTAMVVDQCPGCGLNHLDLFPAPFARLADPSKGVIPVSWNFVPCGITTPIVLRNKEGTSKYWFSMQVVNSNVGVTKLEVSTDAGKTWMATTRKDYNFFENPSGFNVDSLDVRVTSVGGNTIVVKGVSVAANSQKTAGGNFAS
ncbi:barwin-like endoglucanase [Clathrospora elynae]|uniref:Barwin-like endoglucanase n=1 Tax=Clathrospora elynae TaxID=706981 RepID=A0A6A5TDZ3_9PLEO|nr:barwin-like endoglucanase [Clathrospora elynae]